MNEHQRKVMPRIEYQRIGDDVVITQVWPDGTRQQLTMPRGQGGVLGRWLIDSSEDLDRVARKEPHPSPEEDAEMDVAGGCTRTRNTRGCLDCGFVFLGCDCDQCPCGSENVCSLLGRTLEGATPELPRCRKCGNEYFPVPAYSQLCVDCWQAEVYCEWPVTAIADGEVRRA